MYINYINYIMALLNISLKSIQMSNGFNQNPNMVVVCVSLIAHLLNNFKYFFLNSY